MAKKDKFKTGAVYVKFKKNVAYLDSKGKVIEALKDEPMFKKDQVAKLHFRKAGEFAKDGMCDILDSKMQAINTKEVAAEKD